MKRPLVLVVCFVVLITVFRIACYQGNCLDRSFDEEVSAEISGRIYQIAKKEKTYAVYLDRITMISLKGEEDSKGNIEVDRVLLYFKDVSKLQLGNEIYASGKLAKWTKGTVPGQFNEYAYYVSDGVEYKFLAEEIKVKNKKIDYYRQILYCIKNVATNALYAHLEEEDAGILASMLLGEKSGMPKDTKELFQKSGIAHILAISGLHVALFGLGLYKILKKIYLPDQLAVPLTIFFLYSYGTLTGFCVSTNRAVVMLVVSLCSILFGRTYDLLSAASLSACIILLQNPLQLVNCGFLLSFGAVLAIIAIYPMLQHMFFSDEKLVPMQSHGSYYVMDLVFWSKDQQNELVLGEWYKLLMRYVDKILNSILLSGSIVVITLPILAFYYFDIALYSTFLNLLVLPFLSFLLLLGIAVMFLHHLGVIFLPVLAFVIHLILKYYTYACEMVLLLPGSIWHAGSFPWWKLFLYYAGIMIAVILYRKNVRKISVIMGILVILSLLIPNIHTKLSITMVDVGQGDGIVIDNPNGHTYLLDGGSSSLDQVGKYRILPFLKKKGVHSLDYIFVTHSDQDHISAVQELVEQSGDIGGVRIKKIVLPFLVEPDENYLALENLARGYDIELVHMQKGDSIRDGAVKLRCLHPYDGFSPESTNAYSMVLSLEYKSFKMLLTGDVSENGEEALYEQEDIGNYDVYKVAHHGSKYTNSEELIKRIHARYGIVSAGKNNSYGHPNKEVKERLQKNGCELACTIENGSIRVETDGWFYEISGYYAKDLDIFPSYHKIGSGIASGAKL